MNNINNSSSHQAFDVLLNGKCIDTVFYSKNVKVDAEEVKQSLINHDGYDSRIEVIPVVKKEDECMSLGKLAKEVVEDISSPSGYRPLYVIAKEISKNWRPVNYAAKPYLDAMGSLDTIKDMYGADIAKMIVAYFLSNASQWKGPIAKQIKLELNAMLKGKPVPKQIAQPIAPDINVTETTTTGGSGVGMGIQMKHAWSKDNKTNKKTATNSTGYKIVGGDN